MTSLPRAGILAGLLLLSALVVATPAQAQTCTSPLRSVQATCDTVDVTGGWTLALADCLINQQPIGSWAVCFGSKFPVVPLVRYALCYYQTAPQSWLSSCL